jgi:hypothetical protein
VSVQRSVPEPVSAAAEVAAPQPGPEAPIPAAAQRPCSDQPGATARQEALAPQQAEGLMLERAAVARARRCRGRRLRA